MEPEKGVNVRVAVRSRPLNEDEKRRGERSVVTADVARRQMKLLHGAGTKRISKAYTFDRVFSAYSTQAEIFEDVALPIVNECLEGFNCTVFAYGQTGTGKTYTMEGSLDDPEHAGIIPRSIRHVFERLQRMSSDSDFTVRMSFLELYNEELGDLLCEAETGPPAARRAADQARSLRLCDDPKRGVVCHNLEEISVFSPEETFELLRRGVEQRQTAATLCNKNSSRSHSILTLKIMIKETTPAGEELMRHGQLNLVDLAGSECIGRSGAKQGRAREAKNINQSLLTLGRVITALVEHHGHVPYRDSKLTRLLQESLGGRAKTCIIATLSPSHGCIDESASTLEYAARAKNIKNRPEVNARMSKRHLVKEFSHEIEGLKAMLDATRAKNGVYLPPEQFAAMEEQLAAQEAQLVEAEQALEARRAEASRVLGRCEELEVLVAQTQTALEAERARLATCRSHLEEARVQLRQASRELRAEKTVSAEAAIAELQLAGEAGDVALLARAAQNDAEGLGAKVERCGDHATARAAAAAAMGADVEGRVRRLADTCDAFAKRTATLAGSAVERESELRRLCDASCDQLHGLLVERLEALAGKDSLVARQNDALIDATAGIGAGTRALDEDLRDARAALDQRLGEFKQQFGEQQARHEAVVTAHAAAAAEVQDELKRGHEALLQDLEAFADLQQAALSSIRASTELASSSMEAQLAKHQHNLQHQAQVEAANVELEAEAMKDAMLALVNDFVAQRRSAAEGAQGAAAAAVTQAVAGVQEHATTVEGLATEATSNVAAHQERLRETIMHLRSQEAIALAANAEALATLRGTSGDMGRVHDETQAVVSAAVAADAARLESGVTAVETSCCGLATTQARFVDDAAKLVADSVSKSEQDLAAAQEGVNAASKSLRALFENQTASTSAFEAESSAAVATTVAVLEDQVAGIQQPLQSTGETPVRTTRRVPEPEAFSRCRKHENIRVEALAALFEAAREEDASTGAETEAAAVDTLGAGAPSEEHERIAAKEHTPIEESPFLGDSRSSSPVSLAGSEVSSRTARSVLSVASLASRNLRVSQDGAGDAESAADDTESVASRENRMTEAPAASGPSLIKRPKQTRSRSRRARGRGAALQDSTNM